MTKVIIAVSDEYYDRFPEVVAAAKDAGLEVEREMPVVGVVSGSIDDEKLPELSKLRGIASVEQDRVYRIAPPDSELQ
jgi:hypothetical protein